jgi:hypothetical protein
LPNDCRNDDAVTIDVGGYCAAIVDAVVEGSRNYLVTLKENQPALLNEAKEVFAEVESKEFANVDCYCESSRGHGRVEERTYYAVSLPEDSAVRKKVDELGNACEVHTRTCDATYLYIEEQSEQSMRHGRFIHPQTNKVPVIARSPYNTVQPVEYLTTGEDMGSVVLIPELFSF